MGILYRHSPRAITNHVLLGLLLPSGGKEEDKRCYLSCYLACSHLIACCLDVHSERRRGAWILASYFLANARGLTIALFFRHIPDYGSPVLCQALLSTAIPKVSPACPSWQSCCLLLQALAPLKQERAADQN